MRDNENRCAAGFYGQRDHKVRHALLVRVGEEHPNRVGEVLINGDALPIVEQVISATAAAASARCSPAEVTPAVTERPPYS